MGHIVITRVAPYEQGDECAEVTLDSGIEQIRVFAHACVANSGDVLETPLSALECRIEPAPAHASERIESTERYYGYRGVARVADAAQGLIEARGFLIDVEETLWDGWVTFECERLSI